MNPTDKRLEKKIDKAIKEEIDKSVILNPLSATEKEIESLLDSVMTEGTTAINRGQNLGFDPHDELTRIKEEAKTKLIDLMRRERIDELQTLALSELGDDTKDDIYYKYIKPRLAQLNTYRDGG